MRCTAILLGLLGASAVAWPRPVEITVEQETEFGESVFATAIVPPFVHPYTPVKLSPHNYPIWTLSVEAADKFTFVPFSLYVGSDAADSYGVKVTDSPDIDLSIPDAGWDSSIPLLVHAPEGTTEVLMLMGGGFAVYGPVYRAGVPLGEGLFRLNMPRADAAQGSSGSLRFVSDEGQTFGGSIDPTLAVQGLWYRHDQAFRYEPPETPPAPPRVESFTFVPGDSRFSARRVRVRLPRGYDTRTNHRYPVIYAQDGQNVFSPGGAFGSWDLDLTADRKTRDAAIPEVVIVAIDNTSDRILEYIPNWITYGGLRGRGTDYLELIRDELMPEIESRYRVSTDPRHTVHLGSSLGGILGFEAAHEFGNTWGVVIAMSPSFWLDVQGFRNRALQPPSGRARIWLDAGTVNDSFEEFNVVRDALVESGHVFGRHFKSTIGVGDAHNEAAWAGRLPWALRWALNTPDPTPEAWVLGTTLIP